MGTTITSRLALASILLALSSCNIEEIGAVDSGRYTEDFHQDHAMPAGGRLSLENVNGSVEIRGWDRDRIEINGTKYASTKEALAGLKVETHNAAGIFEIRTVRADGWSSRWNGGVRYRIQVPRNTRLDKVQSTNGSLTAEQISASVKLRTTNGSIKIVEVSGEAEAASTNGSIRATGVRGRFAATTTNGAIDLTAAQLDPGASSRLRTTNGSVNLTLPSGKLPDIDASTTNGAIAVRMPSNAEARVRASTSSGRITTDFPVSSQIQDRGRRLDAAIGNGGPLLELRTTNGGIRIEKL